MEGTMMLFKSIVQLDTAILYVLELVSSLSVLLLAFELIASMANVLTKAVGDSDDEPGVNNYERVKTYLALHAGAKVREVAEALTISVSTVQKWMVRIKRAGL
jgi:hypothetical protein